LKPYILLLPILAAVVRVGALPGWWLAELALLAIPLRIWYWEKGGSRIGDYLGGVAHVALFFSFLSEHVHAVAPFFVGLILGAWWLAERWIYRGLRKWMPLSLAAALAVVAAEYFRFHYPMGGVPWGSLALGFADRPVALGWASVFGEAGVSLMVALWGGFAWALFSRRHAWELAPAPLITLLAILLTADPAPTESTVRALGVQANLSIQEKHGVDGGGPVKYQAKDVYMRHARLTTEALSLYPDVDLVVWGETMFPFPVVPPLSEPGADGFMRREWIHRDPDEYANEFLRDFAARRIQPLLWDPVQERTFVTGAHYYLGVPLKSGPEFSPRASEFLAFDQNGDLVDHFSKTKLVPFGESLPFSGKFPGAGAVAQGIYRASLLKPNFIRTGEFGPLRFRGMVMGGAVCWENVFEKPFRDQANEGAEAFLVLSNENWYGLSEEMDQMVAATQYRVRETGRPVFRVANTGISGLFDSAGRLIGNLPRGEEAYFVADLARISPTWTTPYLKWGWLVAPLVAWLSLLGAVAVRLRIWLAKRKANSSA